APIRFQEGTGKLERSRASSISRCWSSSKAIPSGFQSLIPLYGAGLCEAVIMTPQAYFPAPRARVGVETRPASMASEPLDRTPALNAASSMDPVRRGSLPMSVSPQRSPITMPTLSASSGVTSTFPRPRMPDEPKRGTIKHIPVAIEGFCEARVPKQQLYSDPHIHPRTARCGAASGGIGLVMPRVCIEAAIEKAKKKGLRPGRVKGTDGI